jgi:two-component sensor histidine kinase
MGFGTKLIETAIERIGGSGDWDPGGLSVRISLPLVALGG